MPKPIPPATVAASVPPDFDRVYFEDCARFPFDPVAVGYHPANAWWLAEAAFAAYDGSEASGSFRIDLRHLFAAGYQAARYAAGTTQFLAIENEAALIIAFRGTRLDGFSIPGVKVTGFAANWGDVLTDANLLPESLQRGVLVHGGFLRAFGTIETLLTPLVENAVRSGHTVWFCGHSLGAALATIAAYHHREQTQGLYTFGSPRVGNRLLAVELSEAVPGTFRFVHHRDIVTTVPPDGLRIPADLSDLREIWSVLRERGSTGYTHVGQVKYISGGQAWQVGENEETGGFSAMAADAALHFREILKVLSVGNVSPTETGTWPIFYDAIADHAPVYYANKLFNVLEESA